MPKAVVNHLQLNYEIRGSGPNLLFIQGIGADMKAPLSLFNSPMIKHFSILSYDARGLGESDSPDDACSMADLAEDAAQLAKTVGWHKYHVFGASMGGMVAQEVAIKYPEAVDKLVLAVTHAGGDNEVPDLVDKMFDLPPQQLLKAADIRQNEQWCLDHPEALSRMKQQMDMMKAAFEANPSHKKGYQNQAAAVLSHDTSGRLKDILAPTLAFNGKYDGGIPIAAAEKMAKSIRNCRFELVEHGHGSWFFDQAVWSMIIDFLMTEENDT